MIKVALVDDHVIVRSGFAQLLAADPTIDVIYQFSTAKEALNGLKNSDIDVAIVDISMPGDNGLTLLEHLNATSFLGKTIFLSIYDSPSFVRRALELGACGYLSKCCAPQELIKAIKDVHIGAKYLSADVLYNLSNDPHEIILNSLTKREKELFYLFSQGLDVKSVALKLNLSHKTIHVHRANILEKLELSSQIELIQFATKHGFIS